MTYPFVAFLSLAFTAIFSPGPNNIMCMTIGQKIGVKRSSKYIVGAVLGYASLMVLLAFFNAILYAYIPAIKHIMGVLGALYLSYMAWMIYHSSTKSTKTSFIPEEKLFIIAFCLQFINPKAILFGLTILSTFAFPYFQDPQRIGLLITSLLFLMTISLYTWASFGSLLNNFVKKNEKIFNTTMALVLLYCAYIVLDPMVLIKELAKLFS